MDQHETLAAASVSTWNMGLSEMVRDRLALSLLAFGGVLILVWAVALVRLAWEILTFIA